MASTSVRPLSAAAAESVLGPDLAPIAPADFSRLRALIEERCGIQLPDSKRPMVEARLRKRLLLLGLSSFADYWRLLFDPARQGSELVPLTDALTTNKTDFLREPNHFVLLEQTVLPALYAAGIGRRTPVRVWSAAASTGEEPYTLAMVLAQWGRTQRSFDFSILGTDISTRVLARARAATYTEADIAPLPEEWRRAYLLRARTATAPAPFRIAPELRARVQFGQLNLMDADYGMAEPFHIIFCRNVLIYFNRETQAEVARKLTHHLVPSGYLFVGHSESLQHHDPSLTPLAPSAYRYQGRGEPR
jgi:chemotaxis protein methyltransferase CheR